MTDSDELLDDLDALVDVAVKIVNEDRYEGGSHALVWFDEPLPYTGALKDSGSHPSFGLSAKAQDILSDIIAKHKRLYMLRADRSCPNCNGWGIVAP